MIVLIATVEVWARVGKCAERSGGGVISARRRQDDTPTSVEGTAWEDDRWIFGGLQIVWTVVEDIKLGDGKAHRGTRQMGCRGESHELRGLICGIVLWGVGEMGVICGMRLSLSGTILTRRC